MKGRERRKEKERRKKRKRKRKRKKNRFRALHRYRRCFCGKKYQCQGEDHMPPSSQTTAVPSMSYCKTGQRNELMEMRSVLMEITPQVADLQQPH